MAHGVVAVGSETPDHARWADVDGVGPSNLRPVDTERSREVLLVALGVAATPVHRDADALAGPRYLPKLKVVALAG